MTPLRPRSDLVDAGLDWVGLVPKKWQVRRLGFFFSERREKVSDNDFAPLSVTMKGIVPQLENVAKTDDGDNRKRVCAGDFVINSRSDRKGSGGISSLDGSVSLINTVLEPSGGMHIRFAGHLLTSYPFQEEFYRVGNGIVADMWTTKYSEMKNIRLAVPEEGEQVAIADYIDRITTRIDSLIAKKTRFIELLREKRQAVIIHVVTKGLNAGLAMKDTELEWLGAIPVHWSTGQLGKLAISRCDGPFGSGLKSNHYTIDGVRVVRLQNIGFASFRAENAAYISCHYWKDDLGGGHEVLPGDLLMAGLGDERNPLGRACVVPTEIGPAMVKADCYRFRLGPRIDARYAAFTLSATARAECGFLANGATRDRLNLGLASSRVIPIPPLCEQREIVDHLELVCSRIDTLIAKTERSIVLLREHRTALITAAVTGKIDLRGVA